MQKFKEIVAKILEQIKQIFKKLNNHDERITQLENKKKKIKCGGSGPRVTIADVLVEMRNGFNQVNYRLDNIEADVKDLKVRVTKLEDDNVKLKAELKTELKAELKAEMVQLLDERDKKWEANFEDKVIKVIKKFNKSDKN